jgi:multidrug efflux system outer membrane protein
MTRNLTAVLLAASALSACTMAPHYQRPALPVAQAWPSQDLAAQGQASAGDLAWRDVFQDPRLQSVIALALNQNRDLRVAVLNIEKARAQYRIQRAALLPQIDATGSRTQVQTPAGVSGVGTALRTDEYSASLGVTAYELDLFGRVRSLKDAALEQYLATAETRRAVQTALIAEVASDYLRLAADQDLLAVTADTLTTRESGLKIARGRFDAGAASRLEVRQAETLTEQARTDLAALQAQVALDRNALVLVVGADLTPDQLPAGGLIATQILASLPAGLPSDVLVRRPDVLSAEHQLKAMNANIGAARAAFFPRITLTGDTGHASPSLSNLFSNGTGAWSFIPQITLPIFAGGANLANLAGAKADRGIAVAQYEKTVQTAFREVSDALAVQATIDERLGSQERLVAAAQDAQVLSKARYDRGVDSYLTLLDAQRTLFAAQQGLISTRLIGVTNRVTLYKALGGGSVVQ